MRRAVLAVVAALVAGILVLVILGGESNSQLDPDVIVCRELATDEWEAFHGGLVRDPDRAALLSAYESAAVYAVAVCG